MSRIHGIGYRRVISLLLILEILFAPVTVQATMESALPFGVVVGDDQGIKVKSDGEYLIDIRDVAPGKKWIRKITLANLEKDIPYQLTMSVSTTTKLEGTLDLSQAIQMTLYFEGDKVYEGPLSGISTSTNLQDSSKPLNLGVFKSGDSKMLEAHFELDGKKYTNQDFLKKNVVENIWYFKAVKTKLPDMPTNGKIKNLFPRTGEEWSSALLTICIGLFLLLITLLIIKHKRDEKRK